MTKNKKEEKRETQINALSPIQQKAVRLFLKNENKTSVARALGVSRDTVYRWFNNPEFKMAVYGERAHTVSSFKTESVRLLSIMARGWETILQDPESRSYPRISELLLRVTGVLDSNPSIVMIVLQSADPYGQIQELMKMVQERMPMLSLEEQQRLITETSVIDAEYDDVDYEAGDRVEDELEAMLEKDKKN